MREIKFRAWDKEYGKMFNVRDLYFIQEYVVYEEDKPEYRGNYSSRIKLMQYTGLKDKNGVEIYEGDIVKKRYQVINKKDIGQYSRPEYVEQFENMEVVYQPFENTNYPTPSFMMKSNSNCFQHFIGDIEVIGNIYENPELLDKA